MNAMNDVAAAPDRPRGIDPYVAGPRRLPVIRRLLGYGVVVSVLPYLALKALWLGGVMVGVPEGSPARGSGFVGPNIVTALLDVVAIAVALALTHRWGRRLPAWLVVVPAWVGTGLLVPAVVELVNGAAAAAVTGGQAVSLAGGLVEPWAYAVVYTSFGLQGLLLSAIFLLYAGERWDDVVDGPGDNGAGPTRPVQAVLGNAAAAAAVAVAGAHLVMAFNAEGAVTGPYQDGWEYTARSSEVVKAVMALLGAAGVLGLLRRPVPTWCWLAAAWTGTGAMFGYALLTLLAIVAGVPESDNITPLNGVTQLAALLAGMALALTALLRLVERRPPAVDPDERDTP
jgi:hypothetical protein